MINSSHMQLWKTVKYKKKSGRSITMSNAKKINAVHDMTIVKPSNLANMND